MNNSDFDHYNVILTGKILVGFERDEVITSVASMFNKPSENIQRLFNSAPSLLKKDISHKKAYAYQTSLVAKGAEVRLERIAVKESELILSLVPEGEERTPYDELQSKLLLNELIECNQCHKLQTLAPFCSNCGNQLGDIAQQSTGNSTRSILIVGGLMVIASVIFAIWYFFKSSFS